MEHELRRLIQLTVCTLLEGTPVQMARRPVLSYHHSYSTPFLIMSSRVSARTTPSITALRHWRRAATPSLRTVVILCVKTCRSYADFPFAPACMRAISSFDCDLAASSPSSVSATREATRIGCRRPAPESAQSIICAVVPKCQCYEQSRTLKPRSDLALK